RSAAGIGPMDKGEDMKQQAANERGALAACFRGAITTWLVVAALVGACAGPATAQELTGAKTLPDLVAESEWIAVADLVGAHARRNARGNLIVTDYSFRLVQTIEGAPDAN